MILFLMNFKVGMEVEVDDKDVQTLVSLSNLDHLNTTWAVLGSHSTYKKNSVIHSCNQNSEIMNKECSMIKSRCCQFIASLCIYKSQSVKLNNYLL